MVQIILVCERNEKTGIGNTFHPRENPFRLERSFGPRTAPANRMNRCCAAPALARSSWSLTIFPCETPERSALSSNHSASSLLIRTVIV